MLNKSILGVFWSSIFPPPPFTQEKNILLLKQARALPWRPDPARNVLLFPHMIRTGLLVELLLELSPLILDGMLLQRGLEALDGVVHHVHFHQAQHLEDPSETEGKRAFTPQKEIS